MKYLKTYNENYKELEKLLKQKDEIDSKINNYHNDIVKYVNKECKKLYEKYGKDYELIIPLYKDEIVFSIHQPKKKISANKIIIEGGYDDIIIITEYGIGVTTHMVEFNDLPEINYDTISEYLKYDLKIYRFFKETDVKIRLEANKMGLL